MENIDVEYFQSLNVHFSVQQFVDYDEEIIQNMIKNYFENTQTYPTYNSFLGFDIAYYFGMKLINYGNVFTEDIALNKRISTQFSFFKTGVESGYENTYSRVVKYQNYQMKIVY
jgi:hypothetical protein